MAAGFWNFEDNVALTLIGWATRTAVYLMPAFALWVFGIQDALGEPVASLTLGDLAVAVIAMIGIGVVAFFYVHWFPDERDHARWGSVGLIAGIVIFFVVLGILEP